MPARAVRLKRAGLLVVLAALIAVCPVASVAAEDLPDRSLQLYNDSAGVSATYQLSFTINTSDTIGSMELLFCSNSPLEDDLCTPPVGMDTGGAQIIGTTGVTDVTLYPVSPNEVLFDWGPTNFTPPHPVTLTFRGILNPSVVGPYYARLSTYASDNITGPVVNFGGLAFAITNNLQITSIVPPYLTFCAAVTIPGFDCAAASGNYVNFGELSSARSSQAASQLLVSTNAPNGDTVQVSGTTMTSGNNIIAALAAASASRPGSAQFGLNLRANSAPSIGADPAGPGSGQPAAGYDTPNRFQFVNNDVIASATQGDQRRYTVSYLVNIPNGQPPGVYVSTLTYVCAGSF